MTDEKKVEDFEYLFIKCNECGDKAKIAKNKGADWRVYDFFYEFLTIHNTCNINQIELIFVD